MGGSALHEQETPRGLRNIHDELNAKLVSWEVPRLILHLPSMAGDSNWVD